MSETSKKFNEYVGEGILQHERYPYYTDLRLETADQALRKSFLEQVGAGLKGTDYNFFADVEGRVRYSFKSEADRDRLYFARNNEDFDFKVRGGMSPPAFSPKR